MRKEDNKKFTLKVPETTRSFLEKEDPGSPFVLCLKKKGEHSTERARSGSLVLKIAGLFFFRSLALFTALVMIFSPFSFVVETASADTSDDSVSEENASEGSDEEDNDDPNEDRAPSDPESGEEDETNDNEEKEENENEDTESEDDEEEENEEDTESEDDEEEENEEDTE
ncbi:MAG: hypothetical protein ACLFTS_02350, partial [Candidatus Paceibacterota bacterium]